MSEYAIKVGNDYVCNGSFRLHYDHYKVLGSIHEARRFKTRKGAESALRKIEGKYVNLNHCEIVEIKE